MVYPRLKQRLNTFHRHFESVDKFDDEWASIRPEWTVVDRIIATRWSNLSAFFSSKCFQNLIWSKNKRKLPTFYRKGEDGTEYFVKWNELTHDECTWETEADISAFKPQIERFRLIQSRRKRKSLGKTKSIIRDMHAFEGSPKFLSGGTLLIVLILFLIWNFLAWFIKLK